MENDVLDLSRNFIENQKRQIELAKQLIECANGDEEVIGMANEMIKSCEKCISIEENMKFKMYTREEYLQWCKENNVKNPLPEYKRNKMTECGYPTHPYDPFF